MRSQRLQPLRERQIAQAQGRVLEIGIDPSVELLAMARKHTAWLHFPVRLLQGAAEALRLEDHSVDSVVITWTLCSVADPAQVLSEARRVLRPGGSMIFVEHGRAPEQRVRHWQDRITPVWQRLAGGCHLNRPIDSLITRAGFEIAELETGYLVEGPRIVTFHYLGRALA